MTSYISQVQVGGVTYNVGGTKIVSSGNDLSLQASANLTSTYSGNTRGNGAIDLQQSRTANTQVASGDYSVTLGRNNTASGESSTALGANNTTYGKNSLITGNSASNTLAGVVCNNNIVTGSGSNITNVNGNCGFIGIKVSQITYIPIWDVVATDTLIARVHVIKIGSSDLQVQNIIVYNGALTRNDTEYPSSDPPYTFSISGGQLLLATDSSADELQIGIFYTLSSPVIS